MQRLRRGLGSVISTLSVISSVSSRGSRPVSSSTAATVAAMPGEATWRGERLTETLSGRVARGVPARRLGAGDAQHALADGEDRAGLLGDRDELAGRDEPALGVVPARQRLDADDLAAVERDDRLVVGDQLVAELERAAQVVLDPQASLAWPRMTASKSS